MVYVFGTEGGVETLKTKGSGRGRMSGFHEIEQSYPDQTVTDRFRIVRLLRSATDTEGNVYNWYEIDKHFRFTDKFTPAKAEIETGIADAQDATCELSEELDERISEIEDALCELTMED